MPKKITQEEFERKANIIHNNEYDYSEAKYVNNSTTLWFTHKKCGYRFKQKPKEHLRGHGCSICNGGKKPTTNEFIIKATLKHSDEYNYSEVIYTNNTTKIWLTHKICNYRFKQTPNAHLNGSGCPKCSGNIKLTLEEFINRSNIIHENKYDYSLVVYVNYLTKIIIICPIHGIFEQIPSDHLNNCGCPECGFITTIQKNTKWTKEKCLEQAKKYNNRSEWQYSKNSGYRSAWRNGWLEECCKHMEIVGNIQKRCIYSYEFKNIDGLNYVYVGLSGNIKDRDKQHKIKDTVFKFCEKHNLKLPSQNQLSNYITKNEASKLEGIYLEQYIKDGWIPINKVKTGGLGGGLNQEQRGREFIEKARKIHKDNYDYSLVDYLNNTTLVCIICKIHGVFWQKPKNHLKGCNCQECGKINKTKRK